MTRILSPIDLIDLAKGRRKLHYRTTFANIPISIENRKGSRRYWRDPETGEEGSTLMEYPYGYIRGARGADGDEVDVFIGPHSESELVYIVNQRAASDLRRFDEHKVMLGFRSLDEARAAYLRHYDERGPQFMGSIREWTLDRFKRWLRDGDTTEPVSKGGPYIGPRGGLYADPDHKTPWSEKEHGKIKPHNCPRCRGLAHVIRQQQPMFGGSAEVSSTPCRTCNKGGKVALDPKKAKALGLPVPPESKQHENPTPSHRTQKQLSLLDYRAPPEQKQLFKSENIMFMVPIDLFKGEAKGGKYIRRVPYTDSKGKRRYRYYYSETASARDVVAGEEVKLGKRTATVEDVAKDGTITLRIDGRKKVVSPTQWGDMMERAYGPRYRQWAKKRAEQAINAVLRHVPREALADLKGSTDEERLAELRVRVPKVYEKLQRSFRQAGVSPFRAKQILARSLERRRWEPEARAAVLGSILTKRVKATSFDQIVRAAENVAGGFGQVRPEHAAAALELRAPGGDEEKFPSDLAQTAAAAEKELAKLSSLLAKARHGDRAAMADVLAWGVSADATQKLSMLLQAFPGLQDATAEKAREKLAEVPSVAPARAPKREGAHTSVYVAGENGQPMAVKARYMLMEADDVIASHDPTKGFQKRQDYPEGVQERAYHRDQSEQGKVIRNAQRLNPAFVVNTNPDAVNGPPVVTKDGHALGGNSRTMSMQLAYAQHPEKAKELREYLAEHAHEAGFSTDDVKALKNPVLVRVIEPESTSKESQQLLVRQLNESFTQGMDPRTLQVAMGRKLDEQTLAALGNDMKEDETLASFLSSPRSERFVNSLMRNGIIDQRNANQYMKKGTKLLNEDGRVLVERILVGRIVGDADILSNTGARLVGNIANAVPYMVQAKAYGKGYDVGNDLGIALSAYNDLQHRVEMGAIPALDPKMKPEHFDRLFNYFDDLFGDKHPVVDSPNARALLELLIRKPGPQQQAKVWRDFVKRASNNPEGQGGLFGPSKSPSEVLRETVASGLGQSEDDEKPKKKGSDGDQGGLFGKSARFGVPRYLYTLGERW